MDQSEEGIEGRVPLPLHLSSFAYAPQFEVDEQRDLIPQFGALSDFHDEGRPISHASSSLSTPPSVHLSFTPSSPLRYHELKRIDKLNEEQTKRQNQVRLIIGPGTHYDKQRLTNE